MNFFDSVFSDQENQRRDPTMQGISVAKVTGRMPNGTCELQFMGMGGNAPSAPARTMMPGAGAGRGMFMMPEMGDEVVVAFEGGDSNSPIVLGGLFNNQSPAPSQGSSSTDNNIRTIVSRSGHELTMDDSPGGGGVTVKTSGGRSLTLDDSGSITIGGLGGMSIQLDDTSGSLTINAPLSITMNTTTVSIQASAVTVSAGAIALTTSGSKATSTVVIDGTPFASL